MTTARTTRSVDLTIERWRGPRFRTTLDALVPYSPCSSVTRIRAYEGRDDPLKLDWNESTVAPSPLVNERLSAYLSGSGRLNWYPELASQSLRAKLATYTGRRSDELLVTNGSDEALELLCKIMLDPGDEVVVPMPTYTHFLVFARMQGAVLKEVTSHNPFEPSFSALLRAVTKRTKLVYLVSPNNPVGTLYGADEIRAIAAKAPGALVIVDEAYHEFSGVTAMPLIDELPTVVVTRTFSKAFGLASLRLGYLAGSTELVATASKIHNPKAVNAMAQIAGEAALDDLAHMRDYVDQVTRARAMLVEFFRGKGITAHPTPANYVNVQVGDTHRFCKLLEAHNVYARDRSSLPGMEGYVRFTVATVEQTHELLRRLDAIID